MQRDAEADRHGLRPRVEAVDDRQRLRLEHLHVALVEGDEGDERLRGRGAALVGLQVDVQILRLVLNTRVTLGISFWPSKTSGFADVCVGGRLLTLNSSSPSGSRWLLEHDRADRQALLLRD